jgi:hypothetical protein
MCKFSYPTEIFPPEVHAEIESKRIPFKRKGALFRFID